MLKNMIAKVILKGLDQKNLRFKNLMFALLLNLGYSKFKLKRRWAS
jgi:hypothetical protein